MASSSQRPPVHGDKGVYCGGEWVDIENCHEAWPAPAGGNCSGGGGGGVGEFSGDGCKGCPQRHMPKDMTWDVAIIGSGCVGANVARELSRLDVRVLLIEKADDVTQGATKGNSGIVHAGYDDKPGSVRSKYCWPGNQMFPQLDRELHFGFQKNGSLVVAQEEGQRAVLEELLERGLENGVENLRIVERDELRAMEPHLHEDAVAALYSPDAGTVTPYEFTVAVAENAVDNGVDLMLETEVTDINPIDASKGGGFHLALRDAPATTGTTRKDSGGGGGGGSLAFVAGAISALTGLALGLTAFSMEPGMSVACLAALFGVSGWLVAARGRRWGGGNDIGKPVAAIIRSTLVPDGGGREEEEETVDGRGGFKPPPQIRARYVVNAAGLFSDKVSAMAGAESFNVKPRMGEYLLLHKDEGKYARHVIFPAPGKMGKGVIIQPTLWGNLLLGPTARDMHNPEHANQSVEHISRYLLTKTKSLVPHFDAGKIIHSFAGARAKTDIGDWIVGESASTPGFFQCAGVDSPGLAASPAIAVEIVRQMRQAGYLSGVKPNPNFNPNRRPIVTPKRGWKGLSLEKEGVQQQDPAKTVICKCERVTEAEIVDSLNRSLPVTSTQAVRKRTRAGMGHCQGQYCEPRVTRIIARETGMEETSVGRRPWPASSLLPQRHLSDVQKQDYQHLAKE